MKEVTYNYCRGKDSQSEEERNKNENNDIKPSDEEKEKEIKLSFKKKVIIISSIGGAILIAILITIILLIVKPWKKTKNDGNDDIINQKKLNYEEYKKQLLFTTKVDELRRLLINQTSYEDMIIDGIKVQMKLFRKTSYDIYIMSEKDADEENKKYYNKTYTAAISMVSQCLIQDNDDCELKELVDLSKTEKKRLRNLKELNDLKDIPIPVCTFVLTDTNLIISMSCPESLSENIQNGILSDLYYFRPTAKIYSNRNDEMNINEEKDKKNILRKSKGLCEGKNRIDSFCDSELNIVKNSEGYLVSVDENTFTNITTDINNGFRKNKTTKLIDETPKNFNSTKYKLVLNDLLEKLSPYIKNKENDSVEKIIKQDNSKKLTNKIYYTRHLNENDKIYNNYFIGEESLFYKEIFGAKINLNLKIDSGLNVEAMRSLLNLKIDNKDSELINIAQFSNLNQIIKKLISLSNAGNNLAYKLYEKIITNFDYLTHDISIKISNLNSLIVYKELSELFDSSLSLKELNILPINLVEESNNLMNKINKELNEIENENGELNNKINILKDDINYYLEEIFNLMNFTIYNLKELNILLKSPKNKYTEISTYYLNNTVTSYVNLSQGVQDIFINYAQIKDKDINNSIELVLNNFENQFFDSIEKSRKIVTNLYSKLENKSLTIENGKDEDYKMIINNLYNSNLTSNAIVNKIKEKIRKINDFKMKEYKLSDKDIDNYKEILNDSKNISRILDNDEMIDIEFDKNFINFEDNITKIMKYKGQLIEEKITLVDDALGESIFSNSEKRNMKQEIKNCGVDIINTIKRENNNYINLIKENIDNFIKDNLEILNSVIFDLNILLSEESLKEIYDFFEYAFYSSLNAIINDIEYSKNLAIDYYSAYNSSVEFALSKIKDSSEFTVVSFVKTINQTYYKYHDILKSNLQKLRSYINNQLYNDLLDEYKFMIVRVKEILLSIKNNKISDIYPGVSQFEFYKKHVNNIDELNSRIDKYFSLDSFNKTFVPVLNEFIVNVTEIRFNLINQFIDNQHNIISKFGTLKEDETLGIDYYLCIDMVCTGKYSSYKYCAKFYVDQYIKDTKYSIYSKGNFESRDRFENVSGTIDEKANIYNSKINMIKNSLLTIENEIINQNITMGYFTPIKNVINSFLSQKYGEEIVKKSYNYYKNNIEGKLQNILNTVGNKWKEGFDSLESEIKNHLNDYKYSIKEFGIMAQIYEDLYSNNISSQYFDSIINLEKNEFNQTILFYYNYLLGLVNSTYLYIINNIPSNKMMLNTIINLRKKEIIQEFDQVIQDIIESKNNYLNINNQVNILKVEEDNFFEMNSILISHIEQTRNYLQNKSSKIYQIDNRKSKNEYSIASKLYLGNSEFAKKIISFSQEIQDKIFIYLNDEKFKKMISDNWIIDQNDILHQLNLTLFTSNQEIYKELSIVKDNYTSLLEKEINRYFTKDNIIERINELYNEGIHSFNSSKMNDFKYNLYGLLDRIYMHFIEESKRINTTAVSYNYDFSKINNTIKTYREKIFNKIKEIYVKIIEDFRDNMFNNVYKNYIEKGLNEYIFESKKIINNFKEYKLLNSSYNLKNIADEIIENLIYEYKELVKRQIDYKYQMTLRNTFKLEELEDFIDYEMELEYSTILFPILKKKAIYNPGDTGYSEYDLSDTIKNDIDSTFEKNINNITNIFSTLIGKNYEVNLVSTSFVNINGITVAVENNWKTLNFSNISSRLYDIEHNFETFISYEKAYEQNYINEKVRKIIKSNFNKSLDNIIVSFGNDFFERTFKFNKYFKIKDLYDNLKYSLVQTAEYYISIIKEINGTINGLPKELKEKLCNLNNIESLIANNNNYLIELLNIKAEEFIGSLKDNLINYYIEFMENDAILSMDFSESIKKILNNNLKEVRNDIESEYVNILKKYLDEKFIFSYNEELNYETEELINLINDYKNSLMIETDELFILEPENILQEINIQINITLDSIKEYKSQIQKFKIPNELIEYLNSFGINFINPIYNDFKKEIDKLSKNQILSNFEKNTQNYEDSLNSEEFHNVSNTIILNLKSNYFDSMSSYINNYYSKFSKIFEEEVYKENNEIIDRPLEETFEKLLINKDNIKLFFDTLKEFNDYDILIVKNINNLNLAFKESQKLIEDSNYEEENKNNFNDKLFYLKEKSLDYYNNINDSFYNLKQYLDNSIKNINQGINKCINITYETLIKEYKNISEKENPLNEEFSKNEEKRDLFDNFETEDNKYFISTELNKLEHYAKFNVELLFENNDYKNPKLVINIINKSRPKNMILDVYYLYGNCAKKGIKIDSNFNEAVYKINSFYDTKSVNIIATSYTNFEKYEYTTEVYEYEDSDEITCFTVAYIEFCINTLRCHNKKILSSEKRFYDKKEYNKTNLVKY